MKRKMGMICLSISAVCLCVISLFTNTVQHVDNPAQVAKEEKYVALTFDDGPRPETTGKILDILKANNSVGTFFVLGQMAEKSPDMLKQISAQGSEIGNHSFSHVKLTTVSDNRFEQEISKTNKIIETATGKKPVLLRPPYGAYNQHLKDLSDTPLVLWGIDTEDWDHKNADRTVARVLDKVKNGSVVLMHDIYSQTADAVAILVPELIRRGYKLVTVSQLYEARGMVMEKGKVYGTL